MNTRRLVGLTVLGLTMALSTLSHAQVRVDGYFRPNGTYVQPHYRTPPNGTTLDNWSTRGNVNPYTGQPGSTDPYRPAPVEPWRRR